MDHRIRFTSRPTLPDSLTWSDDNQIAVVTFKAVNIVTPQYKNRTVELVRTSILNTAAPKREHSIAPQLQKVENEDIRAAHVWKEGFRCMAWSPTGCSSMKGCLLATVSTHHSVLLWAPMDDPATAEWEQICDLSDMLRARCEAENNEADLSPQQLSSLSVISIGWSPLNLNRKKPTFSLIALGSKDGTVSLWRYREGEITHCGTFSAHSAWVSSLSWSGWTTAMTGESYAYLATSGSDGSVKVWVVNLKDNEMFECDIKPQSDVFRPDSRGASLIKFLHPSVVGRSIRLVAAKGRIVSLWFAPSGESESVKDTITYKLPPTMSVGGVVWGLDGEELRLYTVDGQCYVLALEDLPQERRMVLVEDGTAHLHRDLLHMPSSAADMDDDDRANTDEGVDLEVAGNQSKQLRIFGAATSGNSMFDALVYCLASTSDMEYSTEKSLISHLSLRPTFPQSGEEFENELVARIEGIMRKEDIMLQWPSAYLLWDVIQYCATDLAQWGNMEDTFLHRLIGIMRDFYISFDATSAGIANCVNGGTGLDSLVQSYSHHLFVNRNINALRLMNYLCITIKLPRLEHGTRLKSIVTNNRKLLLQHYIKQTLIFVEKCLQLPTMLPSASDVEILRLYTNYIFNNCREPALKSSLPILQAIHQHLKARRAAGAQPYLYDPDGVISVLDQLVRTEMSGSVADQASIEHCRACQSRIPFDSPWQGTCDNGHVWGNVCAVALTRCDGLNINAGSPTYSAMHGNFEKYNGAPGASVPRMWAK
ncbi:hypothetical protein SpCBS45565_g07920 [Spizellomyces sp. 'palustris']|nr:hypothetical protein SpCBS45565_g07920 [Spizellomyces sp. 'palustris']